MTKVLKVICVRRIQNMEQAVRKIALLGMGTVGGGVYEIIERQKEEMPFKIGAAL